MYIGQSRRRGREKRKIIVLKETRRVDIGQKSGCEDNCVRKWREKRYSGPATPMFGLPG